MIIVKNKEELLKNMIETLTSTTPITQVAPGGIARSLLELFSEKLNELYLEMDARIPMCYVSTATGQYLDMIGELLDCERLPQESDENYRYRITQQTYVGATANETAIILECSKVPGVKDIIATPYTRGIGSFSIHVISDELDTPDSLVQQVQSVIDRNQALGIRGVAAKPQLVPIDIQLQLAPAISVTSAELNSLKFDINDKIKNYIDNLGMGNPVYGARITNTATSSSRIAEANILSVKINDREHGGRISAYPIKWNERFYLRKIEIF